MTSIRTLVENILMLNCYLLTQNTDSLMYEIDLEDVYEKFFKLKHLFDFSNFSKEFDFSNFSKDSKFHDNQN